MNTDARNVEIAALANALEMAEQYRDSLAMMNMSHDAEQRARAMLEYSRACTTARNARNALNAALDDEAKS